MKHLLDNMLFKLCLSLSLFLCVCCSLGSSNQTKWEVLIEDTSLHKIPFLSILFIDALNGIAITPLNLQKTTDGGKTWTIQLESEGVERSFHSLYSTNPTTWFVSGVQKRSKEYLPMILHTENSGRTWQESSINIISRFKPASVPRIHSISFCNDKVGWAVGVDLILYTIDGGRTWETQRGGNSDEVLYGVQCLNLKMAWAVGKNGLILITKDGGKTWQNQESKTQDDLLRVRSFGNTGFALGGHNGKGVVLITKNNGTNWEKLILDAPGILFDVYLNDGQGWIIGQSGTILHTSDDGQTWQRQPSPTSNDLVNLFFLTAQQGWIAGDKNTVLRLSNNENLF